MNTPKIQSETLPLTIEVNPDQLIEVAKNLSSDFKKSNPALDALIEKAIDQDQFLEMLDSISEMKDSPEKEKLYTYVYYHYC